MCTARQAVRIITTLLYTDKTDIVCNLFKRAGTIGLLGTKALVSVDLYHYNIISKLL
jgi:hypothetical protein